jgi:cell division protein FtsL
MQTEWGQLLLEQSAWSMQARIERVANVKLNMQLPTAKSVVMIQE